MEKIICLECDVTITDRDMAGAVAQLQEHVREKHAAGTPAGFRILAGQNGPRTKIVKNQVWRELRTLGRSRYWVVMDPFEPERKTRQPGTWVFKPFNNLDSAEIKTQEQIWRNYELVAVDHREHPELQEDAE